LADEAIPAATLIVVRDRAGSAPDLLMVERAEGMAFAAGALVWPGGRIDQADRNRASELGLGEDGADNVAVAMFSFPNVEAYEKYRREVKDDPECIAITKVRDETACFTKYERTFMRAVARE